MLVVTHQTVKNIFLAIFKFLVKLPTWKQN